MVRLRLLFLLALAPAWLASGAQGQFLFKKTRPTPSQRVPELILTVKTEGDERKRAQAAEELRDYDTRTFTEIVPVLVDVLQHDTSTSVRLEALTSLSRVRPVNQSAGQALEQAAHDESWRVRLQAKSALLKYHLAGYSRNDQTGAPAATAQEPPLADPMAQAPVQASKTEPMPVVTPTTGKAPAAFAVPKELTPVGPNLDLPKPLPKMVAPQVTPAPAPTVAPNLDGDGPALPPRPF
jgi:HEAT repeats